MPAAIVTGSRRDSRRAVSPPGRAELLAAVALACVGFAVMSGHPHSIDGLLMYRQALSIAYDHSLNFVTPVLWGQPFTTSKYGLGLSLLYLPGLAFGFWLKPFVPSAGGLAYDWALFYRDPLYTVACAPVHVVIAACTGYLVARFIRGLGFDRGVALWGLALFGVASPAIVYARGDWAQPLSGLCWIAALHAAMRFRSTRRSRHLWLCAAAVFYGVLTRPLEGSLIVPAGIALVAPHLAFWRWPRSAWRDVSVIASAFVAGAVVTLAIAWLRFGSPFVTGYEREGWTTPPWVGLAGALASPGRGLLLAFPAIVLLPLGLRGLWRGEQRPLGVVIAGLVGLQLLSTATWSTWWGGWNWGLRLFVPALPLVAVLAAIGIRSLNRPTRAWLPSLLLAAGIVWAVPCVLSNLFPYAAAHASAAASFSWSAYPPVWAWRHVERWRAIAPIDMRAVDVLWLRWAHATGNASLLPPVLLLAGAGAAVMRILATRTAEDARRSGREGTGDRRARVRTSRSRPPSR